MPPQAHTYSSGTPLSRPQLNGSFGALALQLVSTSASLPRLSSSWRSHPEPGLKRSGRNERATSRWQAQTANNEFLEWVVGSSSPVEERRTVHPPVDRHEKMLQLGCLELHTLSAPIGCFLARSPWYDLKLTHFRKCTGACTYARSQSTELWKLLLKLN